jgi:hypothetical protein
VSGHLVAEFANLITDVGLHGLQGLRVGQNAALGTGTAAPSNTDTSMVGAVYNTSIIGTTTSTSQSPLYRECSVTYLWEVGNLSGNYSSIGIYASNGTLFSKARILNALGQPTTISVTLTDFIEATYTQREYIATTDATFSGFSINGTSYSGIIRPVAALNNPAAMPVAAAMQATSLAAYSEPLGALPTSQSPGGSLGSVSGVLAAYAGDYQRQATYTFSRTQAVGNIKSLVMWREQSLPYMHAMGIQFANAIPKPDTLQLAITLGWSWGRAP